ncbi:hypothetical protein [Bacteroides sp.]|uniref:hypothetical protein n=1 Tax=Bacteroides sp. TaxID=29523 RepID=UPI0023BC739B|nr:hypothetical protein [Bacteroides sp.]MDE5710763.1 hypothetical protein [Bacteroides sp.]MDE6215774.1 hypothetical protein [Bacteroides sp.]
MYSIQVIPAPCQSLFGFGRSSDKLHSLGPKNVRRTSEETTKKVWSGQGADKEAVRHGFEGYCLKQETE